MIGVWIALAPGQALALEHRSSLAFQDHHYAHRLEVTSIPGCPGLLETLYSMDTMRRLTPFIDTVELLDDAPGAQRVRVAFGVLGFHTALVYERLFDPDHQRIVLRLLHQEGAVPLLSFPTSFEAVYQLGVAGGGTGLAYSQDASMAHRVALPHQLFVRGQVNLFERRLLAVIEEACP